MKNSGQISNWTNSGNKKSWTHFGQSLDKKTRQILVVGQEKIPSKF
jgi:hypothetical protein